MRLNIKKVAKSIPRLAQIPTINPRFIWRSGVFYKPLIGRHCQGHSGYSSNAAVSLSMIALK